MLMKKPVGGQAPALKYDILSALGVHALAGDKHHQKRVLRLIALITTRYNWRRNELSIGREEIARLWAVNERTVKREMARLRSMGWVLVKRPGARGRVTVYELDLKQMMLDTRPAWPVIGPDFVDRMAGADPQEPAPAGNVVPFQTPQPPPAPAGDDVWSQVQAALHGRDPELWSSWFRHLSEAERAGGAVTLTAPSRFIADYVSAQWLGRLLAAYGRVDPSVRRVRVVVAP